MPKDSVRHIGAHVLAAMKNATHKPVKHPDVESKREDAGEPAGAEMREVKGMGARMKNGGRVRKMADGGEVDPGTLTTTAGMSVGSGQTVVDDNRAAAQGQVAPATPAATPVPASTPAVASPAAGPSGGSIFDDNRADAARQATPAAGATPASGATPVSAAPAVGGSLFTDNKADSMRPMPGATSAPASAARPTAAAPRGPDPFAILASLRFADGGMVPRMGARRRMADGGLVVPDPTPAPQFPAFPATAGINQLPALGAGMRKVGAFFDTPPALVTAERGATATPTGGPPTASTPGTSTGSGRGTLNPTDTNDVTGGSAAPGSVALPGMTSTAGAGRGSVNPPVASLSGDARPDLAGIPSLGGATGTAVAGAAGVRKFTTADGRTLYSNVAGGDNDKLMSGNPGVQVVPAIGGAGGAGASGASDVAGIYDRASKISADIARLNAEYRANGGDPGTLTTTPGMSIGSGKTVFDDNRADAAAGARPPSGLSAQQFANYNLERERTASQRAIADQNAAVQTAGQQITAGTARYGVDAQTGLGARRLALESEVHAQDAPVKAATAAHTQAQTAGLGAALSAQKEYQDALTSGDAGRIAAAENRVRAAQGRWEKEAPALFDKVQTGVDKGGAPIYTIFDKRTGQMTKQEGEQGQPAEGVKVGASTKQPDGTYGYYGKTLTVKGGKIVDLR
jgi:hypothetical protein